MSKFLSVLYFCAAVALNIKAETFTINTKTEGPLISSNFASVTIDIQLVWHWSDFPFTNTEMNTLANGLTDTVLRFSGTACDYTLYNMTGNISQYEDLLPKQLKYLNLNQFSQMIHFASKNGWKFTFGLDAQYRFNNNTWDPHNSDQLIDAIIKSNDNDIMDILTLELGNEPDMYPSSTGQYFGFQNVSGQQMARDVVTLYNIIQQKPSNFKDNVKIWGPDVTKNGLGVNNNNFLADYLSELKNLNKIEILDAITWHFYYASGKNWNINDFVNISVMDSLIPAINESLTISATYAPSTRVILGESGMGFSIYANTNASTYVAAFLWLDKLGIASVMGINMIIRQTYWGGAEGLVGQGINPSPQFDYNPNPTYWVTYLWKQIVGTKIVYVNNELDYGRKIRVYAFCSRAGNYYNYTNGDITVVVLNVQNQTASVQLDIDNDVNGAKFDEFMMSGELNSRKISINGKLMQLANNNTLPQIESVSKPYGSTITMQPYTYAYVVAVGARAQVCISAY